MHARLDRGAHAPFDPLQSLTSVSMKRALPAPFLRELIATILVLLPVQAQAVDNLTVKDVIDLFAAAVSQINSYDVILIAECTRNAEAVRVVPPGGKGEAQFVWKPLAQGSTTLSRTRQIWSADDRYRFERLPEAGGDWLEAKVFTGEITRQIATKSKSGAIRLRGPDSQPFPDPGEYYAGLFRGGVLGGDLVDVLRERKNVTLATSAAPSKLLVIESGPQPGATTYPACSWRVSLDPQYGLLPRAIELYLGDFQERLIRYDVEEFREIGRGAWAPTRATVEQGPDGLSRLTTKLRVELGSAKWNVPVADDQFALPFPPGTLVVDEPRGITFVAGDDDPGTAVDHLVENAQQILTFAQPATSIGDLTQGNWMRTVSIALNIALIAGLVCWMALRPRRASS